MRPELPRPGVRFEGDLVIASCWGNDEPQDDGTPPFATLLVMQSEPPFYWLFQIRVDQHGGWRVVVGTERDHANIIPATEDYSNSIGGY